MFTVLLGRLGGLFQIHCPLAQTRICTQLRLCDFVRRRVREFIQEQDITRDFHRREMLTAPRGDVVCLQLDIFFRTTAARISSSPNSAGTAMAAAS